jgi:Ca-activated chloride channel family protein
MTFRWPWMLLLLGMLPLLVVGYRRLLSRRAARRAELERVGLVAGPPARSGRRHLVPLLFLTALALLLVALARPEATVAQPRRQGTVVLAFDVSGSMAATDLAPTRLEAAKSAARGFVEKQPESIKLGVVAFGEGGVITQRPTTDRAAVLAAIARLAPAGGTGLGRGIQTALGAIAGHPVQLRESNGSVEAAGPDLGYYSSAAVVLLTDGENTADPDPLAVAEVSSTAGVRLYPIGLGSAAGTVLQIDGFQVATALDEPLLRKIASSTDGRYFTAADERELAEVYRSIPLSFAVEPTRTEVTALLALGAALLLLAAAVVSLLRTGRVI